ncbi:MAG: 50S ribosomal protein L9 [Alphaproteobacteria bacterium]|nr:50S ribosomal protein L9 [Alphaproteobacteria bacterium]
MEVILLEKIGKIGRMGDKVSVKDGYARNFLIPQKKALRATKSNIEFFESQRATLVAASDAALKKAEGDAAKLDGKSFVVIRQAGDTGHLYGSVAARDVAASIASTGVVIEHGKVVIDTPIKELGIYKVRVALHPEIVLTVKVIVARSEEEAAVAEEVAAKKAAEAAKKASSKTEEVEAPAAEEAAIEEVAAEEVDEIK